MIRGAAAHRLGLVDYPSPPWWRGLRRLGSLLPSRSWVRGHSLLALLPITAFLLHS
ncbi:hypothetical protein IL54_3468 [Sphingobium sp. ba1]|nr:hypothetical protein IL54_3468 [Sphingobium sp. ba1]